MNQDLNNQNNNEVINNQNIDVVYQDAYNNLSTNTTELNNPITEKNNSNRKESLGTAAMIIGIISIVLSIFLSALIFPLALTGLILGIVNKVKGGKKISGIILNTIAIFIITLLTILIIHIFHVFTNSDNLDMLFNSLYNTLEYSTSKNYVAGKYDCTGVNDKKNTYLVTLELNEDNTFLYGPYGNLDNNYAKGTYTFEKEEKKNSGEYKYYMISLAGDKENFIMDGKPNDYDFNSKLEFGLTTNNGKKEGVIIFTNTYNMYFCYER